MPKVVARAETPTILRVREDSPWETHKSFARDYLVNEAKRVADGGEMGEGNSLVFDTSDGVTAENYGALCQTLRLVGKDGGYKVAFVYRDDATVGGTPTLYMSFAGEYKALTPEKLAARQATRAANKAKREAAAAAVAPASPETAKQTRKLNQGK